MENKKKLTKKEKILIIFMIIVSIIAITYKAYSANIHGAGNVGVSGYCWGFYAVKADGLHADEDWPHYLNDAPFERIFNYEPAYFGEPDGVIHNNGGRATGKDHQDNGTENVMGGGGSDGNTGYGGSWNGSSKFDLYNEIASSGSDFTPHSVSDHIGTMDNVIWLIDLCTNIGLLCSQPGGALTGSQNYINTAYAESPKSYEHDVKDVSPRTIKTYNVEETETAINQVSSEDMGLGIYAKQWRTPCQYDAGSSNTCTGSGNGPALAFILSELENISGDCEKTPLQIAWWHFYNGIGETNSLVEAAQDFQNYVNEVKESDSLDSSRISSTGISKTGFNLNYDPKFVDTDVTQEFDSKQNKFIIGPFKLDYVQYENFAYIYKLEVFMNGLKDPIDESKFKIAVADKGNSKSLKTLDEKEFPDKDTDFYIILDYDESFKFFSNIKVYFQYQNANGNYTIYNGTYSKVDMQGEVFGEYNPEVRKKIEEAKDWIREQFDNGYAIWDIDSDYYISNADELLKKYTTVEGALDDKGYDLNFELVAYKYFIPNSTDLAAGWPTVVTNIGTSVCLWTNSFKEKIIKYKDAYNRYKNAETRLEAAESAYDAAQSRYNYWNNLLSGLDESDPNYSIYVSNRNNASSDMISAAKDIDKEEGIKESALDTMGGNLEYGKRAQELWDEKPEYITTDPISTPQRTN